ncbi:hypothetical protein ACNO7T_10785 [Vibrio campbellii]
MSTDIKREKLDPVFKSDLLAQWSFIRYWGASILNVVSTHYVAITSIAVSIFSLVSYIHAVRVFDSLGIEFLHVADISDIYTVALSTGVISSIGLFVILILTGFLTVITVPTALKRFSKDRHIIKMIGLVPVCGVFVSIALLYPLSFGYQQDPSASYYASPFLPRYRLITDKTQTDNECVGLIFSTSSNIISWSYSRKQIEIIPKSKLSKLEFVLKSPLAYNQWFPTQRQSVSDRLKELNQISKSRIYWSNAVEEKCGQEFEMNPFNTLIDDEISTLKHQLAN